MPSQQSTNKEQQYNNEIKNFWNSEACQGYLLPLIQESVKAELPSPKEENWEQKYVYAYALSDVFTRIINAMSNLANKNDYLKEVEKIVNGIE